MDRQQSLSNNNCMPPDGIEPQDSMDRDKRSWIECEDRMAEALFRLSHEIRESRRGAASQFKWFQEHMESATKHDLEKLGDKIMSQLSDFADKVEAQFNDISTSVDGLVTSTAGIDADIQSLKKQIADFQGSPGAITPEDQARLDAIQTQVEKLAQKTKAASDDAAALDAQTETVPTPTP